MGGWEPKNLTAYNGAARSLFSWSTTDNNILLGIGTNTKMYVRVGTAYMILRLYELLLLPLLQIIA
jgi:hypothetical protein